MRETNWPVELPSHSKSVSALVSNYEMPVHRQKWCKQLRQTVKESCPVAPAEPRPLDLGKRTTAETTAINVFYCIAYGYKGATRYSTHVVPLEYRTNVKMPFRFARSIPPSFCKHIVLYYRCYLLPPTHPLPPAPVAQPLPARYPRKCF